MPVPQLYFVDHLSPGLLADTMHSLTSAVNRVALYATALLASTGMLPFVTSPVVKAQSTYLLGLGEFAHSCTVIHIEPKLYTWYGEEAFKTYHYCCLYAQCRY
jgi:hypothetical protein